MKLLFILSIITLFSACSSIEQIEKDLDKDSRKSVVSNNAPQGGKDQFDFYRNDMRNPMNAERVGATITSGETNSYTPVVKRDYRPTNETRRFTAKDLNDNTSDGSLWNQDGANDYLFANQTTVKDGDIILINVMAELKNEITLELKRVFQDSDGPVKKKAATTAAAGAAPEGQAPASPAPENADTKDAMARDTQVYDRVSSVIAEEINKDHLLLKGRKSILFRNKKRLIEIQALVPKKHITNDNTVFSNQFLETSIRVLR